MQVYEVPFTIAPAQYNPADFVPYWAPTVLPKVRKSHPGWFVDEVLETAELAEEEEEESSAVSGILSAWLGDDGSSEQPELDEDGEEALPDTLIG